MFEEGVLAKSSRVKIAESAAKSLLSSQEGACAPCTDASPWLLRACNVSLAFLGPSRRARLEACCKWIASSRGIVSFFSSQFTTDSGSHGVHPFPGPTPFLRQLHATLCKDLRDQPAIVKPKLACGQATVV